MYYWNTESDAVQWNNPLAGEADADIPDAQPGTITPQKEEALRSKLPHNATVRSRGSLSEWQKVKDDSGVFYWWNVKTDETRWSSPYEDDASESKEQQAKGVPPTPKSPPPRREVSGSSAGGESTERTRGRLKGMMDNLRGQRSTSGTPNGGESRRKMSLTSGLSNLFSSSTTSPPAGELSKKVRQVRAGFSLPSPEKKQNRPTHPPETTKQTNKQTYTSRRWPKTPSATSRKLCRVLR